MTNEPSDGGETPPQPRVGRTLRVALWSAAALGVAAVLYATGGALFKPADTMTAAQGEAGRSWALVSPADAQGIGGAAGPAMHQIPPLAARGKGALAPSAAFQDAAGKPVTLADFKGHVVLLNLWATWCPPCKKEMPTLAALQKAKAATGLKVVAVSVDRDSATAQAKAFIAANAPLAFYQDAKLALPFALKPAAQGFPTTVIYDKAGRERARVASDVDWSSPRVARIVDKLSAE